MIRLTRIGAQQHLQICGFQAKLGMVVHGRITFNAVGHVDGVFEAAGRHITSRSIATLQARNCALKCAHSILKIAHIILSNLVMLSGLINQSQQRISQFP